MDSTLLVAAALERVGGSKSALADHLGLGANGYQTVHRWTKGTEPPYEQTIKMLRLLSWLDEDAALADQTPSVGPTVRRLSELAAEVEQQARDHNELLGIVGALQTRLEALESARGLHRDEPSR